MLHRPRRTALRRLRAALVRARVGLPEADALLLLPRVPGSVAVLGAAARWSGACARWHLAAEPVGTAELVVVSGGRVPDRLRAPLVLLTGRDRGRRLRRAGYAVVRWEVRRSPDGVVVAWTDATGARRGRAVAGVPAGRWPRRLLRRLVRPEGVTVATRDGGAVPAAVDAAGVLLGSSPAGVCLVVDRRDERRRAAFLLDGRRPCVVKVARAPETGAGEDRATHEQRILGRLPEGSPAPSPLGSGRTGGLAWSAETRCDGVPLLDAPAAVVRTALVPLGSWLGELAAATAHPVDWAALADGDRAVALRGPAAALRPLLAGLGDVPGVLAHGDLASGHNVVVDERGRAGVLDWETGREHGLPLLDLLPLLSLSLARAAGRTTPSEQAAHVLRLASGADRDSGRLLDEVERYAARLALPAATVGPLALLAWGHQASMRLVRDELLQAAGLPVTPWTSTGELVLAGWERQVGAAWPALQARRTG